MDISQSSDSRTWALYSASVGVLGGRPCVAIWSMTSRVRSTSDSSLKIWKQTRTRLSLQTRPTILPAVQSAAQVSLGLSAPITNVTIADRTEGSRGDVR